MSIRFARVVVALVFAPAAVWAQLHLIAGTPVPNEDEQFASALYKLDDDAAIRRVAELVPRKSGMKWIGLSYELRKAVILIQGGEPPLILDLDTATVVKHCPSPSAQSKDGLARSFYQWLSDVPGRGATLEWYVPGPPLGDGFVRGMEIDPSVPCEKSFLGVSPTEMQYIVAHGTAGVGDYTSPETPTIVMREDGSLATGVVRPYDVSFGYQVPSDLRKGLGSTFARIQVNNSQIMVVGLVPDEKSIPRFLAFLKRDKTWHVIPSRNWSQWCLRGFGSIVTIAETSQPKASGTASAPRTADVSIAPKAESAGRAEWRPRESLHGPNIVDRFNQSRAMFPGRLHLFDVETEKMLTIDTKQGDSEILLVEDGTVYYRISDRLYSASVTDKGIGTPHLLATDEVMRDVHWAFIQH